MTLGTFWIAKREDGNTSIGIEDYDIEVFDGGDYEMIYTFTPENIKKIEECLSHTHKKTLWEMIKKEFGIHLNKKSMSEWLDENNIEYDFFSGVSFD